MRVELRGDAGYIHFTDEEVGDVGPGRSFLVDPPHFPGMLYLEFDKDWCLVGMEVLRAKRVLRRDFTNKVRRAQERQRLCS